MAVLWKRDGYDTYTDVTTLALINNVMPSLFIIVL